MTDIRRITDPADVHAAEGLFDDDCQRRGIGRAHVNALATLARERNCYGMWVLTDDDNIAAIATYRAAGCAVGDTSRPLSWEFSDEDRDGRPGRP